MILKVYIFEPLCIALGRKGVVMIWRVATLLILRQIVRKITTNSMPLGYAGYLRKAQPFVAL
jgi:hypothetical protein